jgi:cytochrome c oxidase cbb3-type subunit I/II
MPAYPHLATSDLDFGVIQSRVDAMAMLGVPYGDAITDAAALARAQASQVAASIAQSGGDAGLETREIVAMIAYMQRLGRDAQGNTGNIPGAAAPTTPDVVPAATAGPAGPGGAR